MVSLCVWVASTALHCRQPVSHHPPSNTPSTVIETSGYGRMGILQELIWISAVKASQISPMRLHRAASVRMLVRLSANDSPPPTLSSGTHRTKPPKWRSSLKLGPDFERKNGLLIYILFQTLIACLFSWCVTITRQGAGRFEVFLLLSFKPNYYKRLEPDLYRDKNSNILMARWLAESTFTAFWSSSGLGRYSQKLHRFLFAPETNSDTSSTTTWSFNNLGPSQDDFAGNKYEEDNTWLHHPDDIRYKPDFQCKLA